MIPKNDNNDILSVSNSIREILDQLKQNRTELGQSASTKAKHVAEYDRDMAVTLMKLKNGVEMTIEGIVIQNPPASIMEKIAKGACWQKRLEMETADALYKANVSNLETLRSELSGWQSIFKYLEEVEKL